jgi:hypothetical protein
MGRSVRKILGRRIEKKGWMTTGFSWDKKSDNMMKAFQISLGALFLSPALYAATINFGGNFRTEAGSYNGLGLGANNGITQTKNFIAARALLNPNLVVDDHFSVKSQWSLLQSPSFTPDGTRGLGSGQGSFIFGDTASSNLVLSRAWLEWTSDIGVLRLGRMPVSWGFGLLYDSGDGVWDDFQSTLDRFEYRLHLGYVVGALAYSKGLKGSVLGNDNDQQFYTAFLRYDNPEVEVEAGLMYELQQRSGTQSSSLRTASPYSQSGGLTFPLATNFPSPLSNSVIDVYLKKTSGYFTYGGEVSWMSGSAIDFGGSGAAQELNAFAFALNTSLDYRKVKGFLEVVYASGDADLNNGPMTGYSLLNRNKRPGLILGRELVGPYYGNNLSLGTPLAYGNTGSFSGVLYFRPGIRFEWSPTLTSVLEVIIARKAAAQAGEGSDLGVEFDFGTEYALYKNFRVGADLGVLAPGSGIRTNPSAAFALRGSASLTF